VVAAMEAVARAPGLVLVVLVALLLLLPALGLVALAQARVSSNGSGGSVSGQIRKGKSPARRLLKSRILLKALRTKEEIADPWVCQNEAKPYC
jgi:hypothetical protein